MSQYYMRADGSAANKAAATSDLLAATSMDVTVHDGETFSAGDEIVRSDAGGVYRLDLNPPSDGSVGNPILYSVSGNPIFSGADVMATWTSYSSNTWQKTGVTTEPLIVVMDGVKLTEGSDKDSLNDHEWVWDTNVLYVRDETGDPDGSGVVIEAGQRTRCISLYQDNYITIRGGIMSHSNGTWHGCIKCDGVASGGVGYTIEDVTFTLPGETCISCYSCDDFTVTGCTGVGDTDGATVDFLIINKGAGAACDTVTVTLNAVSLCDWGVRSPIGAGQFDTLTVGSNSFTNMGKEAISLNDGDDCTIESNTINESGVAGDQSAIHLRGVTNNVVRFNSVKGQRDSGGVGGSGIQIDTDSDGSEVYYNVCWDNDGPGISVIDTIGVDIYNNTCVYNAQVATAGDGLYLTAPIEDSTANINVKNNIFVAENDQCIQVTAAVTNNANIDIDYNYYYRASGDWWTWGGTSGDTIAGWRTTSSQGANDKNADPLLVDAATGNFHLTIASPCIEKGVNVGLSQDKDGAPVPETPDVGAYQLAIGTRSCTRRLRRAGRL